jgi:hypothetical protein
MGGVAKAVGSVLGGITGGIMEGGGMGNSFQATPAQLEMQKDLAARLQLQQQGMGGIQGNQQALAQQLLAQSQGQGPNPAQMMMQQGQDRANMQGAGMIASAKGVNPALAARLAAQNTAQGNQALVQNAGIMGAQQQLGAQNQLGNLYGQMGQQNLGQQQVMQSGIQGQNQANIQNTLGAQQINAGVAGGNAQMQGQLMGGLMSGIGSLGAAAISPKGKAHGGFIEGQAPVAGDSKSNDVVPAMLSPGEVVLPRSIALKENAPELAKEFVEHIMKKERKKKRA